MRTPSRPIEGHQRETIEAVAAFAALMHAHERGDRRKASIARGLLSRLGITVRIARDGGHPAGEVARGQ